VQRRVPLLRERVALVLLLHSRLPSISSPCCCCLPPCFCLRCPFSSSSYSLFPSSPSRTRSLLLAMARTKNHLTHFSPLQECLTLPLQIFAERSTVREENSERSSREEVRSTQRIRSSDSSNAALVRRAEYRSWERDCQCHHTHSPNETPPEFSEEDT
jgi:hypothetical protein